MKPPFLKIGDQVRIVSPSGAIDSNLIEGAIKALESWGLVVTEGEYARNTYGRFAGTKEQRLSDLQAALDDSNVKAILCSRGGYGVAQVVDRIDFSSFSKHPKWLIGFSDITILHNALTLCDVASIHGIMAKQLSELPKESDQIQRLKGCLFGQLPSYSFASLNVNREGRGEGKLIGGNLSVLSGLIGTSFDLPYKGNILFIEEINEQSYHIDRMLQNLRLSGALDDLQGLVVGQFAGCDNDPLMMQTVYDTINEAVNGFCYPVCFEFPAGHVDYNLPLIMGEKVSLKVTANEVTLKY